MSFVNTPCTTILISFGIMIILFLIANGGNYFELSTPVLYDFIDLKDPATINSRAVVGSSLFFMNEKKDDVT